MGVLRIVVVAVTLPTAAAILLTVVDTTAVAAEIAAEAEAIAAEEVDSFTEE